MCHSVWSAVNLINHCHKPDENHMIVFCKHKPEYLSTYL
jgi:hypothetical protein